MKVLNLSNYTVLLVDDVAFSRQVVTKMLNDMRVEDVHHAEDGNEALDVLQEIQGVDFVISDFHMPDFNGLQLLKAIRTGKTAARRDLLFAMLTGYSDRYLVDMALALDVNAFLTKPVSIKALAMRLEKMLSRGEADMPVKPSEAYEAVTIEEAEEEYVPEPQSRDIKLNNVRETQKVLGKLSSLSGKFQESDLVQNITVGIDRLVTDIGGNHTDRVVSFIDDLVNQGILELEDIPNILDAREIGPVSPYAPAKRKKVAGVWATAESGKGEEKFYTLSDIPLGAFLSRDLCSKDGSLFVKKNIPMTQQIISILAHLKKVGAVKLAEKIEKLEMTGVETAGADTEDLGVFANFLAGPENDGRTRAFESESPPSQRFAHALRGDFGWEKSVPAHEIPEGATLTRDIYTVDGRLYMYAGSKLTGKVISILRDLQDLENLQSNIWITIQ